MSLEFPPIHMAIENSAIIVDHPSARYEIALGDIASAELLDELPQTGRIVGSSFDTLKTGRYRVDGVGECHLAITVGSAPYLLIKTKNDERYIFSEPSASDTVEAYDALNARATK